MLSQKSSTYKRKKVKLEFVNTYKNKEIESNRKSGFLVFVEYEGRIRTFDILIKSVYNIPLYHTCYACTHIK